MSIGSFLTKQVRSNQYVQAALLGVVSGVCKDIPGKLKTLVNDSMGCTLEFVSSQNMYSYIVAFVSETIIVNKLSRAYAIEANTEYSFESSNSKQILHDVAITLGYGKHYGLFHGVPVIIHRSLAESIGGFKEILHLRFISRNRKIIPVFGDELRTYIEKEIRGDVAPKVYRHSGDEWVVREDVKLRNPESLFLAHDELSRVASHLEVFENRKTWNQQKGIGHHTGIMLSGEPGTAKTSLIQTLASMTHRDIYILDLSVIKKPQELSALLSSKVNWRNVLAVIEDIDATGADVKTRNSADNTTYSVPLSSLLNILDGISTPDGLVVIATTNHLDRLDPALTRPGRFDLSIHLGRIGMPEFIRMVNWFEMDITDYKLSTFVPMVGAQLRSMLLNGGVKAVENYQRSMIIAAA